MTQMPPSQYDALMQVLQIVGSQNKLARVLGVSQQSVWKMVNKARRMSGQFVLKAEYATGISRHALRPDIYPIEDPAGNSPASAGSPAPAVQVHAGAGDPLPGHRASIDGDGAAPAGATTAGADTRTGDMAAQRTLARPTARESTP